MRGQGAGVTEDRPSSHEWQHAQPSLPQVALQHPRSPARSLLHLALQVPPLLRIPLHDRHPHLRIGVEQAEGVGSGCTADSRGAAGRVRQLNALACASCRAAAPASQAPTPGCEPGQCCRPCHNLRHGGAPSCPGTRSPAWTPSPKSCGPPAGGPSAQGEAVGTSMAAGRCLC